MSDVYLGNPLLKKANTAIEFTQEQIEEFVECRKNPVYFANNYIKIVSLDEGLTQFHPYDFQEKLIKMGSTLLGWLDQESEGHVSFSEPLENMINGSDMNLLRIIHYPPLPDNVEPGEVRAAAHEDINLITLLVTGTEPGLQAKDVNGNWHDVPCKPGYITVNSGDMLSMASKGHYPSTPHRVVNPPKQENRSRYSMPLFVHPRPDVLLDKLTAGEFLDERLKEIGLK